MKAVLKLMALLVISMPALAENMVGMGILTYVKDSNYQPDSCESTNGAKNCLTFSWYRVYDIKNFFDFASGTSRKVRIVLRTHSERDGNYFLVLKKLNSEDAVKFKAQYGVANYGRVFNSVCLEGDIQSYISNSYAKPYSKDGEGKNCYSVDDLKFDFDDK